MLLPLITDEIISGHLILWPSFGILILSFVFLATNTIKSDALVNIIYCLMLLIFLLGIIESIVSGLAIPSDNHDLPVVSTKKYPIEYREETNKLYVFFPESDSYKQAALLTKEFVKPGDTLYIATRRTVGKNLWWSTTTTTSTKPPTPDFEYAKQDTVKLFYNDGKFQAITPEIPTTLEKDSTP